MDFCICYYLPGEKVYVVHSGRRLCIFHSSSTSKQINLGEARYNFKFSALYQLIPCLSYNSQISSSFSSLARKLESFLLPAAQTLRVGVEGKSIATIDIESSSKMEHNSTDRRGGSSTTGAIPIRHIHVGGGNDSGSGNGADNTDGFIVLSYSLSYWRRTINQMKEDILQHRVVCVKSERGPEGLRELDIHHSNSTKVLSQDLGDVKHFVTKNLEGGSNSTKYTDIQ